MLSQIMECGQIKKPIKFKCQGSKLRFIVSDKKFAASEVKKCNFPENKEEIYVSSGQNKCSKLYEMFQKSTEKVFENVR